MLLGAVIFFGIHLVPTMGSLRANLISRLSANGYKLMFTAFSFLGLGLMIWAKSKSPHINVWIPFDWGRKVAPLFLLPFVILLFAYLLPSNIKRFTPHPMLWAFIFWSAGHLLANGDLASIILFGSIGAYSVVAIVSANKRGAKPLAGIADWPNEALVFGLGISAYISLVYLHGRFFGVAII